MIMIFLSDSKTIVNFNIKINTINYHLKEVFL